MDLKKLIKLQNAIIRAHQKINDVQSDNNLQTKEIKDEFKKEFNGLNKTLEQLNEELSSFIKKEDLNKHSEELECLKTTLNEVNKNIDDKISKIQLKHGKDGVNGIDGKDGINGRDGKDGKNGKDGKDGANGLSAYEIAVKQGYEGTEEEWIEHITNNGGKDYSGQIAAMNQRVNKVSRTIKTDGTGNKYLADDGTYKEVSGSGEVPEDVLTQSSILRTIEECEQCQGENVPSAGLLAMTYNSIPTTVSELENDNNFITNDIETDFNIDGNIYLNTVSGSVNSATSSRIIFGDKNNAYSYLASNNGGAFAFSKGNGNILIYPNTENYNCLMSDCNSNLGRVDKLWKHLYLSGELKDGTNSIPISNIATKDEIPAGAITDLGLIDMADYDDDTWSFINTLTETGTYRFVDSNDEFVWYVIVYNMDNSIGQTCFNEEEGYNTRYYRSGYGNEEEGYEWNDWYELAKTEDIANYVEDYVPNYVTDALRTYTKSNNFAINVDIRTYLDSLGTNQTASYTDCEFRLICNVDNHRYFVKTLTHTRSIGGVGVSRKYQEYFDYYEPEKLYKRSGEYRGDTKQCIWGEWYEFNDSSNFYNKTEIDEMIGDIETLLGGI